jgi:hypothetical protein
LSTFFAGQIYPLLEFVFLAADLNLIFQLPVSSIRPEFGRTDFPVPGAGQGGAFFLSRFSSRFVPSPCNARRVLGLQLPLARAVASCVSTTSGLSVRHRSCASLKLASRRCFLLVA